MMMKKVLVTTLGIATALAFSQCNGMGKDKEQGKEETANEARATNTDTAKEEAK